MQNRSHKISQLLSASSLISVSESLQGRISLQVLTISESIYLDLHIGMRKYLNQTGFEVKQLTREVGTI